MKPRKIALLAALITGGLLVCLSAALLARGVMRLRKEQENLGRAKAKLEAVYQRNPFPSVENIRVEQSNTVAVVRWHESLLNTLQERNLISREDSPSLFLRNFEDTRKRLIGKSRQQSVECTGGADFAFGFDRYSGTGVLPEREHVAQISSQLLIIEQLTDVLLDEKISFLKVVRREPVEGEAAGGVPPGSASPQPAAPAAPARPQRPQRRTSTARASGAKTVPASQPALSPSTFYTARKFTFEFSANEEALVSVLNRLASHRLFIIIDAISFHKEVPDLVPPLPQVATTQATEASDIDRVFAGAQPAREKAAAAAPAVTPLWERPKDQRVISGPEHERPLQVVLDLSVYTFKGE